MANTYPLFEGKNRMVKAESPITEYMKIRRYVMTLILRAGQKSVRIPTVVELAEKFGVSRPTVSKAMKALTEDGFIIARPRLGSFTNPSRNQMLQDASSKAVIGILEGDGMIAHYTSYLARQHAHMMLELAKLPVMMHLISLTSHKPKEMIRDIEVETLDLLIWIGAAENHLPVIQELRKKGHRILLYNSPLDLPGTIRMDYWTAGFRIGKKLMEEGRRNLIYLPAVEQQTIQLEGLKKAYGESGIALNENFFLRSINTCFDDLEKMLRFAPQIDAIFSTTPSPMLFEILRKSRPDYRETMSLVLPDVREESPDFNGYTYLHSFEQAARALADRVKRTLDGEDLPADPLPVPLEIKQVHCNH